MHSTNPLIIIICRKHGTHLTTVSMLSSDEKGTVLHCIMIQIYIQSRCKPGRVPPNTLVRTHQEHSF